MVTFYGSHICGGCREAKELFAQKGFSDFTFVEITETTDNLRAFLKLRDHREELKQAREDGMIGIPLLCAGGRLHHPGPGGRAEGSGPGLLKFRQSS